jgi:hypothetical protein
VPRHPFLAVTFTFLVACQPPSGAEGRPCYPNGTCDGELACLSGLCVEPSPATTESEPSASLPTPAPDRETVAVAPTLQPPTVPTGAPEPTPPTDPADDAMDAYRAMIEAWNHGDERGYFGRYAEIVSCWYDRSNRPIAEVRAGGRGAHFRDRTTSQLAIDRLEFVSANNGRVTFIDHGRLIGSSRTSSHRKLIVMQRGEPGWRIIVEGSPEQHSCWPEIPPGFADADSESVPQPRSTCRVLRVHRDCQTTAGEPPCYDRRSYVSAPPVPPGSNRQQTEAALSASEDSCEYGEAEFGPTGRIREVGAWCMGWGSVRHVYEGCD